MVVHFIREHWAAPGVTVTESKFLHDSHLDIDVEVDVVIEGLFEGEHLTLSVEVVEHGRPVDVTWVQRQIARHEYLPTNKLLLVSRSGFSKNAEIAAGKAGGWVQAITPRVVEHEGQPVSFSLYMDSVQMRPNRGEIILLTPDGHEPSHNVDDDGLIYDKTGEARGTNYDLAREILGVDWLVRRLLVDAHNDPDRLERTHFSCGFPLADIGYTVRDDRTGERFWLIGMEMVGEFRFDQQELTFPMATLGGRRFSSTEVELMHTPTIVVYSEDGQGNSKLSWRAIKGVPQAVGQPSAAITLRFPEIRQLTSPPEFDPFPQTQGEPDLTK